jgi:GT2 family glycosyltransferase
LGIVFGRNKLHHSRSELSQDGGLPIDTELILGGAVIGGKNGTTGAAENRLLVVIVNYKTAELTTACLRSLEQEIKSVAGIRVAVVDSASGDGPELDEAIRTHGWESWVTLKVAPRNGGFSAGNNAAIGPALASANPPRFILLLNPDTEVRPGALRILLDFMDAYPEIGIAGAGVENPDGSDWPFAFRFITPANQLLNGLRLGVLDRLFSDSVVARQMDQDRPSQVDWVSGCSIVIRKEVFDAVGLLDEDYFLYFDEVDFCLRARRAGWPCWYVPESRIMHIGGQSSGFSGIGGLKQSANVLRKRVPAYWFESRRHYFLKNFGTAGAIAADLAFGIGYACWRLRRRVQRKPDLDPPHMLADFWRHSVLFGGRSRSP